MLAQIADMLKTRGWDVRLNEDLQTGFVLELDQQEYRFPLYVMELDVRNVTLLRFTIVPFIEQTFDGYPSELYSIIAQINHDLSQLKLAVDADGDLELILDIPKTQWIDTSLDEALQLLVDCTEAFFMELYTIVQRGNPGKPVDAS